MLHDQIIVAVFPSRRVLIKALDFIQEEHLIDVEQAAVIAKAASGRVHVLEDNLGGAEGGLIGAIVGAGLMSVGTATMISALPLLPVSALTGALVGWMVGNLTTHTFKTGGFARQYADTLADHLQAGHPALLIRTADPNVLLPRLQEALKPYRAEAVERLREIQSAVLRTDS